MNFALPKRPWNAVQKLYIAGIALALVAAVLMLIGGYWIRALVLLVFAVVAWLTFPSNDDDIMRELGQYKHVRVDVAEVKAYRVEHPEASLAEATLAVKKRHA
ncbi:hypothetical protein QP027_09565 [Corynebacterium breve]|uniref:Uncharacterized protein n=1 Tax=Corynebacterium breve TaxID=3049799 RepID=A0ABY8VEF8_9CORY|nr:hypothetical protein [Corynebacterium breve]WIM67341.1 hypothetical protein QP027_09565 [Corynebacterium breve]